MSLHQIIYTSCMRGINGVNDGQQVYSYDASFKDANNEEIKSLFSYQPPALDAGVIMTEEIARALPKSFTYRKLENGICALALNTYLGRDYMGSAGRFGNHLSHVVLADEADMQNYPCEFYGSELLRDHMEFEEVNNPNRPNFLPEPTLKRGFVVDIDTVIEFLSVDDRLVVFKDMLHAVLAFESERKRVVICDKPENIIMWIASIEYALPLKTALGINFSTYDFDPSLSASQICGVSPKGTRYNAESQRLHFVFDFYKNSYASFEKDECFFDFIDTAMSFSYDSLQDFHRFLCEGYTYDKADEKMYAGYDLYSLLSDGISGLSENKIRSALDFANKYALMQQQTYILQKLLEQKGDLLRIDSAAFLCVMRYVVANFNVLAQNYRNEIKAVMVDRVLFEFVNTNKGEDVFLSFYGAVDGICQKCGFGVATELMWKNNREKLFAVMQNDISTWKIVFIVKVVSTYVKEQNISVDDLMIDAFLGQTYYGLVQAVYSKNMKNGFYLVTRILDEFASDCNYLVNMALNIEGMLLDLPNGNQEASALWKYFGQLMVNAQQADWETTYAILSNCRRYEQINMLYCLAMNNEHDLTAYQQVFKEHYKKFVVNNPEYAEQYREQILNGYYERLVNSEDQKAYSAKIDLFNIVSEEKLDVPFAENLVKDIMKPIPFESPSREKRKLIQNAFEYLYNNLRKPITGKMLLLVIALVLEDCKKVSQLHDAFENLDILTQKNKADMSRITEKAAEKYFDWLLPEVCELCECKGDIETLYALFDMPGDIAKLFFKSCAKIYLKQGKGDKDYSLFCEFLGVVLEYGNAGIREEIGKVLCKLNKQRMSELNNLVADMYRENRKMISYWDEMKGVAENTNPIINNITNLFKRKRN